MRMMLSCARRQLLTVLLALFLLLASSSLFAKYDPALEWYTQETSHFIFHYHDGLKNSLKEFTANAEEIHKNISTFFNWQPKAKTHVILNDHFDSANGSAKRFPFNVIEVYLTPPSDISGLEDYKNWQYLLFEHEYVHIVHLDMAGDLPLDLRSILGRQWLLFPNQYVPSWIIEGIATYLETDKKHGVGRGQSSYYRALMKNEIKKGIRSLDQVNQAQLDWPGNTTRYLYGVYFFTFLDQHYGKASIQQFAQHYAKFPVPYFVNTVFKEVYGKNLYQLWEEFKAYLHNAFDAEISKTSHQNTPLQQLSHSGFRSGFSKVLTNGDIIFIKNNRKDIKSLTKYTPSDKTYQTIFESPAIQDSFDVHPQQGILVPLVDWVNSSRRVTDLYILDNNTFKKTRITHDQRYIRAIWHPSGEKIVALKNQAGRHQLDLLDARGHFLSSLWKDKKPVVIGSMDFSPSGKKILASVFRADSGWNLEEFSLRDKQWTKLTNNIFIESHAQYTRSGKHILYTAEYAGIYNIFQLSLADKRLLQLTDTDTAALHPDLDEKTHTLYYAALTDNGFNLESKHLGEHEKRVNYKITRQAAHKPPGKTGNPPAPENPTTPYNALKYLKPLWWEPLPIVLVNNEQTTLGLVSGSNDPIRRHNYSFTLAYDIKNSAALWNFNYLYTRLMPDFGFNSNKNIFFQNEFQRREERGNSLSINWPLKKINNDINIFAAIKRTNVRWVSQSNPDILLGTLNDDIVAVGVSRRSTSHPALAVSQHSGSNIALSYELNRFSQPIKPHSRLILNAAAYSPVFFKTVLELGMTLIRSGDSARTLFLGGNLNELFNRAAVGKTSYHLSGYKNANLTGTNLQKLYTTVHIPLTYPQRSLMTPPVGISRIILHPYFQSARIGSYRNINQQDWRSSLGAELEIQANFGYGIFPFVIKTGVANGFNEGGEFTAYFSLLSRFL